MNATKREKERKNVRDKDIYDDPCLQRRWLDKINPEQCPLSSVEEQEPSKFQVGSSNLSGGVHKH